MKKPSGAVRELTRFEEGGRNLPMVYPRPHPLSILILDNSLRVVFANRNFLVSRKQEGTC